MVQTLERLVTIAEAAVRANRAVKALRSSGNGEAAAVLEKECNDACKRIVSVARGRRRRAANARKQQRGSDGRFS